MALGIGGAHVKTWPLRCAHKLESGGTNELAGANGAPGMEEVGDRTTVTQVVVDRHVVFVGRNEVAVELTVAVGQTAHQRGVVAVAGAGHRSGGENVLLHIGSEAFPGDALENGDQQLKS